MEKRILAMLLATVMVLTIVTGCRKNPKDANSSNNVEIIYRYEDEEVSDGEITSGTESDDNKNPSVGSNSEGTGNIAQDEENLNLTGYPIVKNKISLEIMVTSRADIGDITNSQFSKTIQELTNIEIKWDMVPENMVNERKTLALQSDNLPDVFGVSLSDDEINQYSAEGTIIEITEAMLKKYAPNILATYNNYPKAWQEVKTESGKMYSIATFANTYPYGQHFVWVRKTWLDKLGMAIPKTTNDFYKMLVAFRDGDPNGNGSKDEIPYATFSHGGFFFNSWGFDKLVSVSTKGKVTHMYTTDNMKNCITYWNKVYKEGLVDKKTIDNYTGENAAFKTLLKGGKVGAFYYGWPNEAMDDKLLSEYQPIMWPTSGNNGDFPSVAINATNIVNNTGYTITKDNKNVAATLRFLDYLYTNDGHMLKLYGNEGDYYKKVSDTKYVLTGAALKKQSERGPSWTLPGVTFLTNATFETGSKGLIWQKRDPLNAELEKTYKSSGQKDMSGAMMNKSELKSAKSYSSYFSEISGEWWLYVQGKKNLNSDWATLVNQMYKRNLDKYLAYQQSFYDRTNK